MSPEDVEHIARVALRELGAGDSPVTITAADDEHDCWLILVGGPDPHTLTVRAGSGTSPQFVREQIFTQFAGQ